MKKYTTVAEYIAAAKPALRAALRTLQKTIKSAVPGVIERVSYGVPYYSIPGSGFGIAYSAGRKQGDISLFITPAMVQQFAKELKPWHTSGGTVHFMPDHPIPASLVKRIIKARIAHTASLKKKRLAK